MSDISPASILYDEAGHPVAVVQDGAIYRLQAQAKIARASDGALINPATQETLASLDGKDFATQTTLATRASEATLATRASEATLSAADIKLGTIDGVLDAIKDTDGIKKITDQLPAGTNEIGKVAQGTRAAASGGWPLYVVDNAGNVVGVALDDTTYRLQVAGKVAKETVSGGLVHLEAIPTVTGRGRLKSTIYTPDGDPVAFGAISASIKNAQAQTGGGATSLLVDGSSTPVEFTYDSDATYDVSIQEIKFTIAANGITFGTNYFGARSGPLPNGLLIEAVLASGTVTLCNLTQNECFVNFASPGGFEWVVSSKDMLTSNYLIGGGLKLRKNTTDKIRITVRDNLSAAGTYFRCFIKGNLLTQV